MREDLDYLDYLEETIPSKSDEELISILAASPGAPNQLAVNFAVEELRVRGLKIEQTGHDFTVVTAAGHERIIHGRSGTSGDGSGTYLGPSQKGVTHDQAPVGVGGWLALLIADLVILSPLLFLAVLSVFGFGFGVIKYYPLLGCLIVISMVAGLITKGFSVYFGILLYRLVPQAVGATKRFFIIGSLCLSLIWILIYWAAINTGVEIIKKEASTIPAQIIGSWVGCGVWYLYLSLSKRVAATYGLKKEQGLYVRR